MEGNKATSRLIASESLSDDEDDDDDDDDGDDDDDDDDDDSGDALMALIFRASGMGESSNAKRVELIADAESKPEAGEAEVEADAE